MDRKTLSLNNFQFDKTKIDIKKIKDFKLEDGYMSIAVELLKEVGKITALLSCAYVLDKNNLPREWNRNEAILGGLMVRINKLQIGILDQTCQDRSEIAEILLRCLAESIINVKYLLNSNDDELFDEYIEYSLREEKRLLNRVNKNITERGHELPIEGRIKSSIERAIKTSSFSLDRIKEDDWTSWGETIYKRAKKVGLESLYTGVISLANHPVHGNWQDLLNHHLEYIDDKNRFLPETRWSRLRPQLLYASILYSAEINKLYLSKILPGCPDREKMITLLDDIMTRTVSVDKLHEEFLQDK